MDASHKGRAQHRVRGSVFGGSLIGLPLILAALLAGSIAQALTEEETRRAEALIPLLEGAQEFRALGEFVHMGPPAIPVLAQALQHPSRRVRMNAIEALYLIKDKSATPFLTAVASNDKEVPAVREKALRVVVRLDPANALTALQAMAADRSDTIRNAVVNESQHVRDKAVIDLLIRMLADDSRSVADGALRTLWKFTGRLVEGQDFAESTKEQRVAWSSEWAQWWAQHQDKFNLAPATSTSPTEPAMPPAAGGTGPPGR